jgi:hypothetical protein
MRQRLSKTNEDAGDRPSGPFNIRGAGCKPLYFLGFMAQFDGA